jgi:hypothetical protein
MQITNRSPLTGKDNTLDLPITEAQLNSWKRGEGLIQNIMPDLTPDQREFLISGSTPEDWATLFPPEDPAKATGDEGI